jgi:hypothetical protein
MSSFDGEDMVMDSDERTSVEINVKDWNLGKREYMRQCCDELGHSFAIYETRGIEVCNIGFNGKDLSELWDLFGERYLSHNYL